MTAVTVNAAARGTSAAFGWYGSKARLAPRIAAMAAAIPHRVYVEPYAGSAAVLFRKPRCPVEIINDLDGDVVNFFRVLRDHPRELARACRLTAYAREQYETDAECDGVVGELERARPTSGREQQPEAGSQPRTSRSRAMRDASSSALPPPSPTRGSR